MQQHHMSSLQICFFVNQDIFTAGVPTLGHMYP